MIYIWQDMRLPNIPPEVGNCWVDASLSDEEAEDRVREYIRMSFGRIRYLIDQNIVVIHGVWDASDPDISIGNTDQDIENDACSNIKS